MPAISTNCAHDVMPRPVMQDLLAGNLDRQGERLMWSMSLCAYPDILVVDGWKHGPSWIPQLMFSRTVPREAGSLRQGINDCAEQLRVAIDWRGLLRALAEIDASLAKKVRAAIASERAAASECAPATQRAPKEDMDLIVRGFKICCPRPVPATAVRYFEYFLALRKALEAYVKAHGCTPEGELLLDGPEKMPLAVDCAVLREIGASGVAPERPLHGVYFRPKESQRVQPGRRA